MKSRCLFHCISWQLQCSCKRTEFDRTVPRNHLKTKKSFFKSPPRKDQIFRMDFVTWMASCVCDCVARHRHVLARSVAADTYGETKQFTNPPWGSPLEQVGETSANNKKSPEDLIYLLKILMFALDSLRADQRINLRHRS